MEGLFLEEKIFFVVLGLVNVCRVNEGIKSVVNECWLVVMKGRLVG